MRIYRIVGTDGKGMYTGNLRSLLNRLCGGGANEGRHPSPYEDGIPGFDEQHNCGFHSVKQLLGWMEPEWIKELAKAGGRIEEWMANIEDVLVGDKQVVFVMSKAKLLSNRPLNTFDDY